MLNKITLTILIFSLGFTYQGVSQKILNKNKLANINLKGGYNYSAFTSNKKYLAWGEFYTRQIYIYNLEEKKIETVIQKNGRGPNEYIVISSLALTNDNKLIITDPENIKLIIYDLETDSYEEDVKFNNIRLYRTVAPADFIFSTSIPIKFKSLYYILNLDGWDQKAIDMEELNNNEFSYPFEAEGYITANDTYGIHLTRYYPHIYVIDLQKGQFLKKIIFDKTKTEQGKTTIIKGNKAFLPPRDVKVLNTDVTFMPNSSNSILILAEGKGEQRDYDTSNLRVYDVIEEEFTNMLDLGVSATKITVNDKYLFVYSEEENEIFQYELIPAE